MLRSVLVSASRVQLIKKYNAMNASHVFCALVCIMNAAVAQHLFNCPSHWVEFKDECLLFEGDSPGSYEQVRLSCSDHGASLVSVLNREFHNFIRLWLKRNDPFLRQWYTSGTREKSSALHSSWFIWEGAGGTIVQGEGNYWTSGDDRNNSNGVIVYGVGEDGYGWTLASPSQVLPYICQVPRAEAYRIVYSERDYDYGLQEVDFNNLERGPHFIRQPRSLVIVGKPTMAEIECLVESNPPATYRWYTEPNFEMEVTSALDSRYTLTNGKLIIQSPRERPDGRMYRCTAENKLGLVVSNEIRLTFGNLGEFSNVPDAAVNAKAYEGVAIQCSKITYKPAAKYNWYKENTNTFIRTTYQTYQFISQNGKLYFSEVTRADEGRYHCIAELTGVNRYTIGTSQPPTRTSLAIPLVVHDQSPKKDWGPEIQDDFIAIFPQPPLRGQDVRLECFAYGSSTTPFHYRWDRKGMPLPEKAVLSDHNRVLTIPDARMEDQGTYTCIVSRSSNARDSKSVYLALGALPYFISRLKDQHVDVNSTLTWRCDARASPPPVYTWFKNGKVITSDPENYIDVNGNYLRIRKLDPVLHDGMYQCGASNVYGMTLSEGHLRVLAFPPSFAKNPLRPKVKAAMGGNLTLTCNPEGAPTPLTSWIKNNSPVMDDGSRVRILPNGNLVIRGIQTSDEGTYICQAVNDLGSASSSSSLTIAVGTFITQAPASAQIPVNSTAFLGCSASYDPLMDLVYNWYFNGKILDIAHRADMRQIINGPSGLSGLYILGMASYHAGFYECVARTTLNEDRKGAMLTFLGPPSEPTGCFLDEKTLLNSGVDIFWTQAASNGRPISQYVIEMSYSFLKDHWEQVHSDSPNQIQTDPVTQKMRRRIENLKPGNGYQFRVLAVNIFGSSKPSVPSAWVQVPSAPPIIAPSDVGGGGGSVGDLTIKWTPLEPWEESGQGIGYKVYWREFGAKTSEWKSYVLHGFNDHHVSFVGVDNYFLEYEVKVQAFNDKGFGPNSTEVVVFSAEDLPVATPTDVRGEGYNGTANLATWKQIPATREAARGIVLGYQVNYWIIESEAADLKKFIRFEGQVSEGIYLGLESDTFYYTEVRAYNSAGLSPPSEVYLIESRHAASETYPEEVRVYSAGHGQVLVWWRGIHITQPEATVHGFVIYFWPANEHYRSACEILIHDHHAHDAHVTVDAGVVYALRVSAYSYGGYGKKTPTMYFTLEGEVTIDQTFAKEIVFMASASLSSASLLVLSINVMFNIVVNVL